MDAKKPTWRTPKNPNDVQLKKIEVLRVTPAMKQLLEDTATHCGLDVSELIRSVARGVRNGRAVNHVTLLTHCKSVTNSGTEMIHAKGVYLPAGFSPDDFRAVLAARCMYSLRQHGVTVFATSLVEGQDYVIESEG